MERSRFSAEKRAADFDVRDTPKSFSVSFEWEDDAGQWQALKVLAFEGEEELSRPFSLRIEVVDKDPPPVGDDEYEGHPAPEKLLGRKAVLSWGYLDSFVPRRYVFGHLEAVFAVDRGEPEARWLEVTLVPPLLHAMHNRRSRVFRNQERKHLVVDQVLKGEIARQNDVEVHCSDTSEERRRLTLQVDESDFAFASRTLESLGVTYHFEHAERGARMVLRDTDDARERDDRLERWGGHDPVRRWPGFLQFRHGAHVEPPAFEKRGLTRVLEWSSGSWQGPFANAAPSECSARTAHHRRDGEWRLDREARLEGQRHAAAWGDGVTSYPNLRTGTLIHYGEGAEERLHLVERVHHVLNHELVYRAHARVRSLPARGSPHPDRVFRPQLRTPKPCIHGVIRGRVASHEEDGDLRYGQAVSVHLAGFDEPFMVQLGQPVANGSDRVMTIPTQGAEVLIAFENGDPDYPYIVASVVNDELDDFVTSDPGTRIRLAADGTVLEMSNPYGRSHLEITTDGTLEIEANNFKQTVDLTETKVAVHNKGTLDVSGLLEIHAGEIRLTAGRMTLDAGLVTVPGMLKCDTIQANVVVAASYTPGAGNIW